MSTFVYTAVTAEGAPLQGEVTAEDRGAAIHSVEALGLVPVQVTPASGEGSQSAATRAWRPATVFGGVGQRHVLRFVRQLGNLLTAGVHLARALSILCRESSSAAVAAQWSAIRAAVVEGAPLADAMARFPRSFAPMYVAMVRAGETGGFLDVVLRKIAAFMSRQRELKSKVGAALIYPILLAVIATGVVTFLLYWFIPRFSVIYDEFGQSLPLLTRLIRQGSELLRGYGLLVAAVAVVVVTAVHRALRSAQGRRVRDRWLLRVPGIGGVAAGFALVRFCGTLGTLIGAGVPLVASLRVAKQAVGNQTLTDALDTAIVQVQEGGALAPSLANCPRLFPGSVIETIAVAEQSGRLAEELERMAEEFEQELDRRLRTLVALVEPALLFVMAALVGAIVIGMLLPVFDLWGVIQ